MLLNLDGWNLTHTGDGFEHYDAIGYAPEKNGKRAEVVIEMKFRNKYYKEKLLEVSGQYISFFFKSVRLFSQYI